MSSQTKPQHPAHRPSPRIVWLIVVSSIAPAPMFCQNPPTAPDRPWHSFEESAITSEARRFGERGFSVDGDKIYSLAELIDLAEAHNPETRVGWENARAQAAALGIARSELYPALSAVALSGVDRDEAGSGSRFYRQTKPDYQGEFDLNYTIFDFGARGAASIPPALSFSRPTSGNRSGGREGNAPVAAVRRA